MIGLILTKKKKSKMNLKNPKNKKTREKSISAYPLKPKEVLEAMLDTKPPKEGFKKKKSQD